MDGLETFSETEGRVRGGPKMSAKVWPAKEERRRDGMELGGELLSSAMVGLVVMVCLLIEECQNMKL